MQPIKEETMPDPAAVMSKIRSLYYLHFQLQYGRCKEAVLGDRKVRSAEDVEDYCRKIPIAVRTGYEIVLEEDLKITGEFVPGRAEPMLARLEINDGEQWKPWYHCGVTGAGMLLWFARIVLSGRAQ